MAGNTLKLEIITPECVTVSDETTSIVLNAIDGYLGIWPNHAPLIAGLRPGAYETSQGEKYVFVAGGFVEVSDNIVSIIAPAAERAADIDLARAEAAKKRAEERLRNKADNVDTARAQAALARAIGRINTVNESR
mgnify:CR=1 FL=1